MTPSSGPPQPSTGVVSPSMPTQSTLSSNLTTLSPNLTTSPPNSTPNANRSRRRSKRGRKGAAEEAKADEGVEKGVDAASSEMPPVDAKLLSSMTELIESLVESNKKRQQQEKQQQQQQQPASLLGAADLSAPSEDPSNEKRKTRSSGDKRSLGVPRLRRASTTQAVKVAKEERLEGDEPPLKRGRGLDGEDGSKEGPDGALIGLDPASLTPIPSPTETNSVGGGETSSTSNDAAECHTDSATHPAEVPRQLAPLSADGSGEGSQLSDMTGEGESGHLRMANVDLFKADYAKALAFSPPRLHLPGSTTSSLVCLSTPFQRHFSHHPQTGSSLFSASPNDHLFPAPPKLKIASSPPASLSHASASSLFSSSAQCTGRGSFSSPPQLNITATTTMTTTSTASSRVMPNTTKGKLMNPLEIRVEDRHVVGGADLVHVNGPPTLFSPSSPRRAGSLSGGAVSPRAPWKSPKKSGKTRNRQSRRYASVNSLKSVSGGWLSL